MVSLQNISSGHEVLGQKRSFFLTDGSPKSGSC